MSLYSNETGASSSLGVRYAGRIPMWVVGLLIYAVILNFSMSVGAFAFYFKNNLFDQLLISLQGTVSSLLMLTFGLKLINGIWPVVLVGSLSLAWLLKATTLMLAANSNLREVFEILYSPIYEWLDIIRLIPLPNDAPDIPAIHLFEATVALAACAMLFSRWRVKEYRVSRDGAAGDML